MSTSVSANGREHLMRPRILAVGDNVVDRYLDRGVMYPGGNAVNVAVHLRRLSADAAYLGVLGNDDAGRTVLNALDAESVDTALLRIAEGPNAYAMVTVRDGNRVFGAASPGVSQIVLSQTDLLAVSEFDLVHTGECSALEDQLTVLGGAAQRLSFDFSERPWDYVKQHAGEVDIAIRSCPGGDRKQAFTLALELQQLGPSVVAVTLGSLGALILAGDTPAYAAPPRDTRIVDTLGAGDAFIARFLLGVVLDEDLQSIVTAATAFATGTCAAFGAFGYETPDHATIASTMSNRLDAP